MLVSPILFVLALALDELTQTQTHDRSGKGLCVDKIKSLLLGIRIRG